MNLAEKHNIKEKLYNGDGLERIYSLLGELESEEQWSKLIKFLKKEARVHQQRSLIQRTNFKAPPSKKEDQLDNKKGYRGSSHVADGKTQKICSVCGERDHVASNGSNQTKFIPYFSCRTFVEMTPKYRIAELQKKCFCFQCLYPGANKNSGKHRDGHCQTDFVSKHPSHDKFSKKKHVLVCEENSQTYENKRLLEEYKSRCILKQKANLPEYSKEIKLSFHASNSIHINNKVQQTIHSTQSVSDIQDKAIYILQTIDMVSRYSAIKRLRRRAKQEYRGPMQLGGVGGVKAESKYGIYQVKLPLCSGSDAILSGVYLEKITESFPTYPLQGKVMQDILSSYKN